MTISTECVKAVGTTFGTYCIADFLSNFIQHPTQKTNAKCTPYARELHLKRTDARDIVNLLSLAEMP
eukprot:scaffold3337_cov256-Chaetoceros_neogracile.AAC.11